MTNDSEKIIEFPVDEIKGRLVNGKFRKKTMKQQLAEMTLEERQLVAAELVLHALEDLVQLPNGQVCLIKDLEQFGYKMVGGEVTPVNGDIMDHKIIAEFSKVIGCERCAETDVQRDTFFNLPQPGFIGKNYAAHKVIFIGQNPGTSPDHFSAEDKRYADLLLKLQDERNAAAYSELYAFLLDFMQKWQVNKNYFPLSECGLELEDIAYFNLVRCRTQANAVPGRNVTNACMRHFVSWIEMLSPAVVVCIGKNPYDGISHELEQRGIPCCFINRARDLNNSERQINRNNAGNLVKNVLSGKPIVKTVKPVTKNIPEVQPQKIVKMQETPKIKVTLTGDRQSMFRQILKALGFEGDIAVTKVLKHRLPVPSMYFNSNADHEIYFTAWEKDLSRFPANLWLRVEKMMKVKGKDMQPGKINVVPKLGKEEEAFRKLLNH